MNTSLGVREPLPGVTYAPADRLARYVAAGELGQVSLVEALVASFERHRGRVALYSAEGNISYAQLDEITDRFAAALVGLGLRPLDRVLFQSANSPQLILAVLGCLKAGLIPVCTLAGHRESEISYLGRHTAARVHIVQGDDEKFDLPSFALSMRQGLPEMRHIISLRGRPQDGVARFEDLVAGQDPGAARGAVRAIARDPFQVAVFQLSGGTSGVPKVIPRMQNEYLLNARRGAELLGFTPDDVMFMPMPMMHNAAMGCMWLPTLLTGAAYAVPTDMTPQAWGEVFRLARPTWAGFIRALIPRFDAMIDQGLAGADSVRMYWTPDAARLAREKYGKPAIGMFGMSEGMNMYPPLDAPREALDWTAGVPLSPLDEVRLVEPGGTREVGLGEVGEMQCRGPYTISGYYDAPERNAEAFTPDGFYKTGDLMLRREIEGKVYYAFAGRTKDLVDRGHEKVNCEEVENAVSTHPSVAGCAVVGMPDEVLGERICIYVVVRHGQAAPSVASLGEHLRKLGLARFKWPERVELADALPLTKVGKLDKAVMRADIRAKLQAAGPPDRKEGMHHA
ncbi:MAG: AMP-dependent synthetase and ligase [Ramlibacter sp.]|nr:AMP-dependent synthetase and ligase [Ramlibacter sp.]